jgi:hypothetical protein
MRPRRRNIDDDVEHEYQSELAAMSTPVLLAMLTKIDQELAQAQVWTSDEAVEEAAHARAVGHSVHRSITRDENGLIRETVKECFDSESRPLGLIRNVVERDDDGSIISISEFRLPWSPAREEGR